jgi:hypothetical protein
MPTGAKGMPNAEAAGVFGDADVLALGKKKDGSPGRTRTSDPAVNSRLLYRLSYRGTAKAASSVREIFIPQYERLTSHFRMHSWMFRIHGQFCAFRRPPQPLRGSNFDAGMHRSDSPR